MPAMTSMFAPLVQHMATACQGKDLQEVSLKQQQQQAVRELLAGKALNKDHGTELAKGAEVNSLAELTLLRNKVPKNVEATKVQTAEKAPLQQQEGEEVPKAVAATQQLATPPEHTVSEPAILVAEQAATATGETSAAEVADTAVPAAAFVAAPLKRRDERLESRSSVATTVSLPSRALAPSESESESEVKPLSRREVSIDSTTAVPMDLYWSLLSAGERAKNNGSHQLRRARRGEPQHLVLSTKK